ncbi:MAG: hypothetical protein V8Q84_01300 [Bilophila sp.]
MKPSSASATCTGSARRNRLRRPPRGGFRFDAAADFGTVESLKSVNQLFMPVSGEVIAVNEELESTPTLVNVLSLRRGLGESASVPTTRRRRRPAGRRRLP